MPTFFPTLYLPPAVILLLFFSAQVFRVLTKNII